MKESPNGGIKKLGYLYILVGARDGRTQSARACLFFFFFHSKPIFQKKKILVLNLGSPPEKGGEKKNPGINHGQVRRLHSEPAGNGPKKKKKKTLAFTLGSPPDLDFRTWTDRQRPVVTDGLYPKGPCLFSASSGHRQTASSGHRRTDRQVN